MASPRRSALPRQARQSHAHAFFFIASHFCLYTFLSFFPFLERFLFNVSPPLRCRISDFEGKMFSYIIPSVESHFYHKETVAVSFPAVLAQHFLFFYFYATLFLSVIFPPLKCKISNSEDKDSDILYSVATPQPPFLSQCSSPS